MHTHGHGSHGTHGSRRSWLMTGLALAILAGLGVAVALGASPWILIIGAMALVHLFMHAGGHGGHGDQSSGHRGRRGC